jgi:hypothetical protein
MAPQGEIRFRGITDWISVSCTWNSGIAPSVFNLVTLPIERNLPQISTLTLSFDRIRLVFPDCAATSATWVESGGAQLWNLQILDRRWRWRFGEIRGRYNTRLPNGKIQAGREKTPRELMTLLLTAMGEQKFAVNRVPNGERPEVDWTSANPAIELQRLCTMLKCRVVLKLDNTVEVFELGPGKELPLDLPRTSLSVPFSNAVDPDAIKVVGGPNVLQQAFELKPVGLEIDGTIKPINQLSYTPVDGWEPAADLNNFSMVTGSYVDEDGKEKQNVDLAKKSVFSWYQIDVANTIELSSGQPFRELKRVVPLKTTLLENIEAADGSLTPKPFVVTGVFWPGDTGDGINLQQDVGTADEPATYDGSPILDTANGVVQFRRPLAKFSGFAADLYLTTSFNLFSPLDGQPWRLEEERQLPGARRNTGPMVIRRDDIFDRFIDGVRRDPAEVRRQVNAALDDAQRQFAPQASRNIRYEGLVKLDLDGAIEQLTWSMDGSGTFTRASRNWSHNFQMNAAGRNRVEAERIKRDRGELDNV